MSFDNWITVDDIPAADFTCLWDFISSFTEENDEFFQIISREKLTSLNFVRHSSGSYCIQFSWVSQTRDDKTADKIRDLFSPMEDCIFDYECEDMPDRYVG